MPRDWKGPYSRRLQVRASERGRRMAEARWQRDRQRRAALAALRVDQLMNTIVRRVIVVDTPPGGPETVREAIIRAWDTPAVRRRIEKTVLQSNGGNRIETQFDCPNSSASKS